MCPLLKRILQNSGGKKHFLPSEWLWNIRSNAVFAWQFGTHALLQSAYFKIYESWILEHASWWLLRWSNYFFIFSGRPRTRHDTQPSPANTVSCYNLTHGGPQPFSISHRSGRPSTCQPRRCLQSRPSNNHLWPLPAKGFQRNLQHTPSVIGWEKEKVRFVKLWEKVLALAFLIEKK